MSRLARFTLMLAVASLWGCSSFDSASQHRAMYIDTHPELSEEFAQSILAEEVSVGMTAEMVTVSWGNPSREESFKSGPVAMQWTYGNIFTNGTLIDLFFNADQKLVKVEQRGLASAPNSAGSLSRNDLELDSPSRTVDLAKSAGGNR